MYCDVRHCIHVVGRALSFGPGVGPVHDEVCHWVHLVAVGLVGPVVGPVHCGIRHCDHPGGGALLFGPGVGPGLRIHCYRRHHHRIGTEE